MKKSIYVCLIAACSFLSLFASVSYEEKQNEAAICHEGLTKVLPGALSCDGDESECRKNGNLFAEPNPLSGARACKKCE